MKQGIRLIFRPRQFFNQLQWSTHHWVLLTAFVVAALVEAQVGRQAELYTTVALLLERVIHVSPEVAMWLVAAARVGVLLAAALVLGYATWAVGSLFGRKSSQRVLFRRLAVVFTVALGGFAAQHQMAVQPHWVFVVIGAYSWSALLGYYALREQFKLSHPETMALGVFLVLATSGAWHWTNRASTLALAELEAKAVQMNSASKSLARPASPRTRNFHR